ncbi:beta-ketoacyl-ACP synthase III [Pirellulimonas nuda]|uniref:beta-ketoacyl-ACP synthase III n=1 Tax=Pirellulimonas nuda TaxID=2528009 RepID=UPI0018D48B9E|nr:beta-ketoacyl-ACP synthase III [Pirellulimonas nuda]
MVRRCAAFRLMGVRVLGSGSFVPDNVVTNDDLASLGCDAEWIVQRTGIRERRHAPPGMATSDMAVEASRRAIAAAGVDPAEIDLVVLATLSPDHLLPQTASAVQDRLGLNCAAMDVSAACAGFVYALVTGAQFVGNGCARSVLVIGADTNSRVVDPADKKTYPLFGDGAGAVVIGPGSAEQGLLSYTMGADGAGTSLLYRPTGGVQRPFGECLTQGPKAWVDASWMKMDGRPVFKWAVRLMEDSFRQVLQHAGQTQDRVDLWLLHQANMRILDAAITSMGIEPGRVPAQLDRYGNTSAGSIPMILDEALLAGRIQPGNEVMFCGFGAGLSWGTALWKW